MENNITDNSNLTFVPLNNTTAIMEISNLTFEPLNNTAAIMENISASEGNSSFPTRSENSSMAIDVFFSYVFPYLASGHLGKLAEFEVFVKSAFVNWYNMQIRREIAYYKMHYEILLLVICFRSAVGKDTDVCGLSLVWSFYMLVSYGIKGRVWISIVVSYAATCALLAYIPNYFSHLTLSVDVLAIYTINCYIVVGYRRRTSMFHNFLWLGLAVAASCGYLYNPPSSNMDDMHLMYLMLVSLIAVAIDLEQWSRPVLITFVLGYCLYIKYKYSDVKE